MKNLKNIKVLFLEDNKIFAENTIKILKYFVYDVIHCTSIKNAKELFEQKNIGLIISDLKVDDGIAIEFIKYVREQNMIVPIVVLSAHRDEEFLLKAIPLRLTAYMIKPIDFNEFESILERCSKELEKLDTNIISLKDDIFYDVNKKAIIKNGENIDLSKKEAIFVELLCENKNRIISKKQIAQEIWSGSLMTEPAFKNFLLRVRQKIGKNTIVNIQGLGYKL